MPPTAFCPPIRQVGAPRVRPQEPEQRAARRVELKDPRAGNASVRRYYLAPALTTAAPGEAEALYLLMKIAGLGGTSRIYQKLVAEEKIASSAGGWYSGLSLDSGSIGLYAVAAEGVPLDKVEQGIDRVVHDLRENGITEAELERAKKQFLAEFVYESDSQEQLARRYGSGLALGMTIDQINSWPAAICQGHGGAGQRGCCEVPRHPPVRDRNARSCGVGTRERRHASRAGQKELKGER